MFVVSGPKNALFSIASPKARKCVQGLGKVGKNTCIDYLDSTVMQSSLRDDPN